MQSNLERISELERRLSIAVPADQVNSEIDSRLKKLARTVKLHGFRPGKVPLKIVVQQYGGHVRQEVMSEALQKHFYDAVREQDIKVAGFPRFEAKSDATNDQFIEFNATFEVYPQVTIGDLSQVSIKRPKLEITDAEVDKTIEILRKQRRQFFDVDRASAEGDQVTIDFLGTLNGVEFDGGSAKDFGLVIGEGQLLKAFEEQLVGMTVNSKKTFEMDMPADYFNQELAGKKVSFEVVMHKIAQAKLPDIDAEFTKQLGVDSGDLGKFREGIRSNLVREVERRIDAKVKDQAMQVLVDAVKLDPPKGLVQEEVARLIHVSRQNLEARGVKAQDLPVPPEIFEGQAKKNVSLGIIVGELVKKHGLEAKPDQVKQIVHNHAEAYERPEEVVKWYYQSQDRIKGAEGLAIENNVVAWVLDRVKIENEAVSFDELMGKT